MTGRVLAFVLALAAAAAGCADIPTAGTPSPVGQSSGAPVASTQPPTPTRPPDEVVLTFAGDVHFAERTTKLLDDPATAFGPIAEVFTASDLALVNLETAVTTGGTAEPKRYLFRAPPSAYDAVKAAGIDAVSIGNNHSLDYGRVGLADTLKHAEHAGVPTFGAGLDAAGAYAAWITEVNQTRIAVLGISQVHELETSWNATDSRPGVAHARDVTRSVAAVKAARQQADFVIVFMHWGKEGNQCPTAEMKSFAQKLADAGTDLIVGTHAHLLQGDGWLGGTYVAYGLGNFLWWWNDANSNDTGVLRVTLRAAKITDTEFLPAHISRETGQPIPVTGAEASRISAKFAGLRDCTGLAAARQ
jgi:poly-gamma-glutamate capsule biosynthesis protein CapA/YwtB (metallophosphatase superfamily)